MNFFESKEFWAAAIQAAGALVAAWLIVHFGLRSLSRSEVKRLRVSNAYELAALRFVLLHGGGASLEARERFAIALNGAQALYGDDADVVEAIRDLRSPMNNAAKDAALLKLLRKAAASAGLPATRLSNEDLVKAFTFK